MGGVNEEGINDGAIAGMGLEDSVGKVHDVIQGPWYYRTLHGNLETLMRTLGLLLVVKCGSLRRFTVEL